MTVFGVTGHSKLDDESVALIYDALSRDLRERPGEHLHGVTCLARGADQIFAEVLVDLGGSFDVILPADDYRGNVVKPENRDDFDRLITQAASVTTMPFKQSNRDAYLAAGEKVLARSDHLIAIWDGQPADGRGGTADVVSRAQSRGLPVTVVWPEGARRA